ncbi:piggyBac transposable element-derived protein 4-like [Schistocerca americana]|uniref:piggyBac transposable element-derived protein 4-like n=1 Tax=Schistocerca americana TaxID=7009 RepID=UPI001F4F60E2|nr:piggyBac transposable element-derived protein 4-like [Schistocerca americana]
MISLLLRKRNEQNGYVLQKKRIFIIDERVWQILEACSSDDEDNLLLNEEDKNFLEGDMEGEREHVVIEDPEKEMQFKWSRTYQPRQFSDNMNLDFGKVLFFSVSENCEMRQPFVIFSSTIGLKYLVHNILIPESTRHAEQSGNAFSTNEDEIKAFIGMNLVMGYHILPPFRSYWATEPDLGVPYIAQIMPLHRFEEIRKYLHFSNNADQSIKEYRTYKVRPVITHLNQTFQESLSATRAQTVDEHMIRFKGHNIMRQYVKNNPVKWSFKMCWRSDSETGYLFECPEVGLGESVVLQLTKSLSGLGCEIYIDNFFNSPALQYYLGLENIRSCGTVCTNRKNIP